jgi:hypothetical protein
MPGAAIFTRVPDAAKRLTPLQRDVLIALLGFCRFAPFCWPGQRRLAREIGRSLTRVNAGIGELVDLGAIRKRMQPGRQTCIYEIGAEFWIPRKRANASNPAGYSLGTCSARGTESDSTFKKKTPRSPRSTRGAPRPSFQILRSRKNPASRPQRRRHFMGRAHKVAPARPQPRRRFAVPYGKVPRRDIRPGPGPTATGSVGPAIRRSRGASGSGSASPRICKFSIS